ncbi:unnamed protein product [Prorocentrum cordatum]|uniref:Uncharacterized protein n=1 Tax=Prorocentrum cordatum TaxID=2364126 RepID=A0ABN9UN15_9DINO|nr:unnamed protein product [Polarella glacialis]
MKPPTTDAGKDATRYAFQDITRSDQWHSHMRDEHISLLGPRVRNAVRGDIRFIADMFLFYGLSIPGGGTALPLDGIVQLYRDCKLACPRLRLPPQAAEALFYQVQAGCAEQQRGLDELGFLRWLLRAALRRDAGAAGAERAPAGELAGPHQPLGAARCFTLLVQEHLLPHACAPPPDAFEQTARDHGTRRLLAAHEQLLRAIFECFARGEEPPPVGAPGVQPVRTMVWGDFCEVLAASDLLGGLLDERAARSVFASCVSRRAAVACCGSRRCAAARGSAPEEARCLRPSRDSRRSSSPAGSASDVDSPTGSQSGACARSRRCVRLEAALSAPPPPPLVAPRHRAATAPPRLAGGERAGRPRGSAASGCAARRSSLREPGLLFEDFQQGLLAALWHRSPSPLQSAVSRASGLLGALVAGLSDHWLHAEVPDPETRPREHQLHTAVTEGLSVVTLARPQAEQKDACAAGAEPSWDTSGDDSYSLWASLARQARRDALREEHAGGARRAATAPPGLCQRERQRRSTAFARRTSRGSTFERHASLFQWRRSVSRMSCHGRTLTAPAAHGNRVSMLLSR